MKSKKKSLFFLYFIFLTLGIFLIINIYSVKEKNNLSNQRVEDLESPCRGLVRQKSLKKQKKIIFSKRIDRLNQMMETPIDWIFKDIKGEVFDLHCYKGKKKIVINLWATWCPPCIEELPSLSALADRTAKDIIVIAITTESLKVVNPFLQKSFPDLSEHLKIVKISEKELRKRFFPDSLPVTYLFAKNGHLKNKIIGSRDWLRMGLIKK